MKKSIRLSSLESPSEDEARKLKRERRMLKRELKDLVICVETFIRAWDAFSTTDLAKKSTVERGRAIGRMMTWLEMRKDSAKRFGLGLAINRRKQLKPRLQMGQVTRAEAVEVLTCLASTDRVSHGERLALAHVLEIARSQ